MKKEFWLVLGAVCIALCAIGYASTHRSATTYSHAEDPLEYELRIAVIKRKIAENRARIYELEYGR